MSKLVLMGGSYFDTDTKRFKRFQKLTVRNGLIESISENPDDANVETDGFVYDLNGCFVIPGLIDAHVHLIHGTHDFPAMRKRFLTDYIRHGITTVRCVGDDVREQLRLMEEVDSERVDSPRVLLASPFIEGDHPYHRQGSIAMTCPEAVRGFVQEMCGFGVHTFKLYSSVGRKVGRQVIETAREFGRQTTCHLQWGYHLLDAVNDGVGCVEHTESIFEFILPECAPRWPELHERRSFSARELRAMELELLKIKAELDLDSRIADEIGAAMREHGTTLVPNLVAYKNWVLLRDEKDGRLRDDLAGAPDEIVETWRKCEEEASYPERTLEMRRRQFEKINQLTRKLHKMGINLMVGTDAPVPNCLPGFSLHQEMELLVEAGIPAEDVLIAATTNAARHLKLEDIGEIAPGKRAEIVVLDGDPLRSIGNIRRISSVIRGENIYGEKQPDRLKAALPRVVIG